jgi:ubiquinone biosynthesis monooxygenase Coq7
MSLLQTPKFLIRHAANLPVYDFLAPSLVQQPRFATTVRWLPSSQKSSAAAVSNERQSQTPKSGAEATSNPSPVSKPLTQAQRDFLTSAVRFPFPTGHPMFL